jgi:hypothetical protein
MGKNTGDNYRIGSVRDRSQTYNPRNDTHVKRNDHTGRFMGAKSGAPYKGVAKEPDHRK